MQYNPSGWSFDKVRDEILLATKDSRHEFYESTIGDLVGGYDGDGIVTADGSYVLTETGFKSLCERVDYPFNALKILSPQLRQAVVRERAESKADTPIKVATSMDQIDSIFSAEYQPIGNGKLMVLLDRLLPEDATVHRYQLSRNNRTLDLRVVCRDSWALDMGNGHKDPGFGGLHIRNDELGDGALRVSLALTRAACLNTVLSSKEVMRQEHRWFSDAELMAEMRKAVASVHGYANEEAAEMRTWRSIPIPDPQLVFTQIGERAGVPQYAMESAREYWHEDGENHNQFAVIQALAHGMKLVTERARVSGWDERNRLELALMNIGTKSRQYYDEHDHEHTMWQECVACHRPLEG